MEVRCRNTEMHEGHEKPKEKELGALPRAEVTSWPVHESREPRDPSATIVTVSRSCITGFGGTKDDICQRTL